jgi:hypothetical protein
MTRTPRSALLALPALVAVLALGACGGGDDEKKSDSSASDSSAKTTATPDTGTITVRGSNPPKLPAGLDSPRIRKLDACFRQKKSVVVVNPASQFNGEYQLVVGGGTVGVVYGFKDAAAANAAKPKILKYEGGSQRKVEVIGSDVIAYFRPGDTLAKPGAVQTLRGCVG